MWVLPLYHPFFRMSVMRRSVRATAVVFPSSISTVVLAGWYSKPFMASTVSGPAGTSRMNDPGA